VDTGEGYADTDVFGDFRHISDLQLEGGGGSQLGLWICKSIIDRHSGNITCFSDGRNQGSTFTIELDGYQSLSNQVNLASYILESLTKVQNNVLSSQDIDIENPLHISTIENTSGNQDLNHAVDAHSDLSPFSKTILPQNCRQSFEDLQIDENEAKEHGARSPLSTSTSGANLNPKSPTQSIDFFNEELVLRILLVDDSRLCRKIVREVVTRCAESIPTAGIRLKLDILDADDGLTAIHAVHDCGRGGDGSGAIDCIFMDNTMIKCHGPAAARVLRGTGFTGSIYGLTGNAVQSDVDEFVAAGANRVI